MGTQVSQSKGWLLYGHPVFIARLGALIEEVKALQKADPQNFHREEAAKLLVAVRHCIFTDVPADPAHTKYRLGKTLGPKNGNWRRVKKLLPPRYRLFFQFRTVVPKTIIYAWLNDECTLRKAGAKTDCYAVFAKMLKGGKVPNTFAELEKAAKAIETPKTA
jgi:toxin YhaV